MFLCCVESFSLFQSKLNFLQILKVAKNLIKAPVLCSIGFRDQNLSKLKRKILHFNLIHIHVLFSFSLVSVNQISCNILILIITMISIPLIMPPIYQFGINRGNS